jgi:hypothetical protein
MVDIPGDRLAPLVHARLHLEADLLLVLDLRRRDHELEALALTDDPGVPDPVEGLQEVRGADWRATCFDGAEQGDDAVAHRQTSLLVRQRPALAASRIDWATSRGFSRMRQQELVPIAPALDQLAAELLRRDRHACLLGIARRVRSTPGSWR